MKLRAFLFEDEPDVRLLLQDVLEARGYEVFSYVSPKGCRLKDFEQCPCSPGTVCADVIISDIRMPTGNGLDFIEELFAKGCRRPAVAIISGSWTEADMERAERLGCRGFWKPIRLSDLYDWLTEVEREFSPERKLLDFPAEQ